MRLVPIPTPFPDIAVHVLQPEGVGEMHADGDRSPQEISSLGKNVRLVPVEIGQMRWERLPKMKGAGRTGTAGKFPFSFGWQLVDTPFGSFVGQFRQPMTEFDSVAPCHLIDRPKARREFHRLVLIRVMFPTRVLIHQFLILALSYGSNT
jgi:hypothetical protein